MRPCGHILGMSKWEETQTQNTLEGLHIPAGLGKPQDPPGAGLRLWLGIRTSAQPCLAYSLHNWVPHKCQKMEGWNCNSVCICHYAFAPSSNV